MARQSSELEDRLKRKAVLAIPCPKCNAIKGERCIGVRGQTRFASHQQRWETYRTKEST